jgi:hypothetical protein
MSHGVPSKQLVSVVGGTRQARNVEVGDKLWSLDGTRTVPTTVVEVTAAKAREVVDVVTDRITFTVAPGQELATPDGRVLASRVADAPVVWTPARKLCRERLVIKPGYELGYVVGAMCADATVGRNCVSLVVNDEAFAGRHATCLTGATGLGARLEPVTRPSGFPAGRPRVSGEGGFVLLGGSHAAVRRGRRAPSEAAVPARGAPGHRHVLRFPGRLCRWRRVPAQAMGWSHGRQCQCSLPRGAGHGHRREVHSLSTPTRVSWSTGI